MSYGFWTEHYSEDLSDTEKISKEKPVSLKMISLTEGIKLEAFMEDYFVKVPREPKLHKIGLRLRPKGSNTVFVLRFKSYTLESVIDFNNATYQEIKWSQFRNLYGVGKTKKND